MPETKNQKPAPDEAAINGDLEQLQAKLAEAEKVCEQYLDLAKRTQAEFENYQKRIAARQRPSTTFRSSPARF